MATAIQVARYVRDNVDLYGRLQLLKLVYYAQAWSLVWDGRPLFDDRIEAWSLGPVVPSVYEAARYHPEVIDSAGDLSADEASIVDAVIDYYGRLNGSELSVRTHQEQPWLKARNGLAEGAWGNDEVSRQDIRRFHTLDAIRGAAPIRRGARRTLVADRDSSLAEAADQAERWGETLAILAKG